VSTEPGAGQWDVSSGSVIARLDRKMMPLRAALAVAFEEFYGEINTGGEREELKRIIATIQIKRDLKKDRPGQRDLTRIVSKLENQDYFGKRPGRRGDPALDPNSND
jgi:hypothetical protein